ncbi:hypothetical protein GCM10009111_33980 [Colwellia asteriadis]|uniref:Serine aminopeptidase S33 domain-containing protein n=1 Tax=Colwellia asteriadis TaxID=517723 RepID=A0ABN1LB80_9GAMM
MMINMTAEFYSGNAGPLFQLKRSPENICAYIIYVTPLFEQANQTRHMQTRLALNAYQLGVESLIYDHYGCGDSGGELSQASLSLWQQDLIAQINAIKAKMAQDASFNANPSSKPIYLSCLLSSALVLNSDIIALIDGLLLAQPEFNGKRFVQQFKRLALASNLTKTNNIEQNSTEIEIAGYVMQPSLLDELSQQTLTQYESIDKHCHWLEWSDSDQLPMARAKQQQLFSTKSSDSSLTVSAINDVKFWQSTELTLSEKMLSFEEQTLRNLLKEAGSTEQGGSC